MCSSVISVDERQPTFVDRREVGGDVVSQARNSLDRQCDVVFAQHPLERCQMAHAMICFTEDQEDAQALTISRLELRFDALHVQAKERNQQRASERELQRQPPPSRSLKTIPLLYRRVCATIND